MFIPIHKHFILKATTSNVITSVEDGKQLLVDLVHKVGMNPVTEPQAIYVNEAGNEGLTGSINLATSHIAFHIWDKKHLLMLDLYSCKDFDENNIIEHLNNIFGGMNMQFIVLNREDMSIIREYKD